MGAHIGWPHNQSPYQSLHKIAAPWAYTHQLCCAHTPVSAATLPRRETDGASNQRPPLSNDLPLVVLGLALVLVLAEGPSRCPVVDWGHLFRTLVSWLSIQSAFFRNMALFAIIHKISHVCAICKNCSALCLSAAQTGNGNNLDKVVN